MKKIFTFFIFYLILTQKVFSMNCQQLCQLGDYSACQKIVVGISCENKVKASTPTINKLSKKYQRECDANNGESCLQLGILLEKGKQIQKNVMRAEELYKKACNLDSANACAVLGTFYAEGIGSKGINLDAAFIYTEKACKKEHYSACVNLGVMYLQGQGVEKNFTKAVNIFNETCNKGSQISCENYEYLKNKKTFLNKQSIVKINKSITPSNNVKHNTNRHTSSQSTCSKYHVVTVKQLNIRNSPKKPSKIIGKINRGEKVCIYEFSGKWGRTDRGWISGKYLERSKLGISISTGNKKSKIDLYMITSTPLPTRIDKG